MKKLIVGNWKMNLNQAGAKELASRLQPSERAEVLVCPPYPYLQVVRETLGDSSIMLGAQDCSQADNGAHTGDVSAGMLADMGCEYVILGHSERRQFHHETSYGVSFKVMAARRQNLEVIVCIGETDGDNQEGYTQAVLQTQLEESLPDGLSASSLVVAYEPVWAIGTGRVPSTEEIESTHAFIREHLNGLTADFDSIRILYGGSVNGKNAKSILELPNVDGVLVGGSSLKADEFNQIIAAAG